MATKSRSAMDGLRKWKLQLKFYYGLSFVLTLFGSADFRRVVFSYSFFVCFPSECFPLRSFASWS